MYILNSSYREICDLNWETNDKLPDSGIVHVPFDHIYEFFQLIDGTPSKYIVVSSNSDYCLTEQEKEPVERDMNRYFHMIDTRGLGYQTLVVPARCDVNHCRLTDKYSVKMYSYTKRTFNEIPANVVMWFCTNSNVADERIVHIPFGIPDWSKDLVKKTVKSKFGIYINYQKNTIERLNIQKIFTGMPDVLIEDNVSHEQFIERVKEYPFIIAPPGNGYDSYRILESIYCGSLPVIVHDTWSKAYDEIPCVKVESYYGIYNSLLDFWEQFRKNPDFIVDTERQSMLYWQRIISESRGLL